MIVVDASVMVTALADDGADGALARQRTVGEQLLAPHLIDIEVVSALRRLVSAGERTEARALQAVNDLQNLRMQRVSHQRMLSRCWQLRSNMTAYDAAYVALAERTGLALVTADAKIANAPGIACTVELL